ncbi:MAG: tryptophan-rich sensory protein [Myxococcales bacterium]|nr:tryptophan-rich sensory protein [Myxococcales bacterium]
MSKQMAVIGLMVFLAVTAVAPVVGGMATASSVDSDWFRGLAKPRWNPPGWVFGPVWTTLYTLMGLAAWRVWRQAATGAAPAAAVRRALVAFGVQLVLNAAWTPVFFGAELLGAALTVIVVMLAAIGWTIRRFGALDRAAAWMLTPYLAWVAFATLLNAALWRLNP